MEGQSVHVLDLATVSYHALELNKPIDSKGKLSAQNSPRPVQITTREITIIDNTWTHEGKETQMYDYYDRCRIIA